MTPSAHPMQHMRARIAATLALPCCFARADSASLPDMSPETFVDIIRRLQTPLIVAVVILLIALSVALTAVALRRRNYRGMQRQNVLLRKAVAEKESANEARRMLEAERIADEKYQKELQYRAEHDAVTGLWNKQTFYLQARKLLDANPDKEFLLVRWDIERFKVFNDQYGMEEGDRLLAEIGRVSSEHGSDGMVYGHIDADHFVYCIPKASFDPEQMLTRLGDWFDKYPVNFKFIPCVGIYQIDDPAVDVSLMCDRALLALRTVKGNYNRHYAYYDDTLRDRLLTEQQIVGDMAIALEEGQFQVWFQPLYNYDTRKIIGAEALVRWNHPTRGMIPPDLFIPIFEKNGFISAMDAYVWERTCAYMRAWLDKTDRLVPVSVAVNLSRMDIFNPALGETLQNLLEKYRLPMSFLRLEITESAYVENAQQLIAVVRLLKERGFTVEMDDFGSGYSSLNALKDIPVDVLKLDLNFLAGTENTGRGGNILSSIVHMARWLRTPVIAEGVETREQADYLKSIGCIYMQGYYFHRPMPAEQFEALLCKNDVGTMNGEFFDATQISGDEFWDPESQMALIFNSFVGGAAIWEYTGGVLEAVRVNENFYREIGMTQEEYDGYRMDILRHFTKDDQKLLTDMLDEALRTGDEAACEVRSCLPNSFGAPQWYRMRVRVLTKNGRSVLYYAAIENVTALKLTEHERTLSKYSRALYSVYDEIYEFDCTRWTAKLLDSRYAPKERIGQTFDLAAYTERWIENCVFEEDRPALRRFWSEEAFAEYSKADAASPVIAYRARGSLNETMWIQAVLIHIENGSFLLCNLNVTERKRNEQITEDSAVDRARSAERLRYINQLKKTEYAAELANVRLEERTRMLDGVISSIPVGIGIYEVGETIVPRYVSERLCHVFGYTLAEYEALRGSRKHLSLGMDPVQMQKKLSAALADGSIVDETFPANAKDGSPIFVHFTGLVTREDDGAALCYAVLSDVTESVVSEQRQRWQDERYRILMESANTVTFDYDPVNDRIYFTRIDADGKAVEAEIENYRKSAQVSKMIHPDHIEAYLQVLEHAMQTPGDGTFEHLSHFFCDDAYRWSRARYVSLANKDGRVERIVGKVDDIQREKDLTASVEELRKTAEIDSVTGTFNKAATESIVERYIAEADGKHESALFVLDVDNFKNVNDTLGHLFGDAFLKEVGASVAALFRTHDIVGRIGGDEFVVFMTDIREKNIVSTKAEEILQTVQSISVPSVGKVGVSIGAVVIDTEIKSYADAFRRADHALYEAKRRGKANFVVYDASTAQTELVGLQQPLRNTRRTKVESQVAATMDDSVLVSTAFQMLYRATDLDAAINEILRYVGSYYGVSRAYIFENSVDDRHCSNTFEWCAEGISPEIGNLQMLSYEEDLGGTFFQNFDSDGVFYCRDIHDLPKQQCDILEPQGIKSMLQSLIVSDGKNRGYVGFDQCGENRFWTQAQINILVLISELLSTFLIRQRTRTQTESFSESMNSILENYTTFLYVIDPVTFNVLYVNRHVRDNSAASPVGKPCYQAFAARDSRCPNCPAEMLLETGVKERIEIYNESRKVWFLSEAARIRWFDEEKLLVTSQDISRFKQ